MLTIGRARHWPDTDPLNLNTATAAQLRKLPGIIAADFAKKIIAGRQYKSIDGLATVGIPAATVNRVRLMVSVEEKNQPAMSPKKPRSIVPLLADLAAEAVTQFDNHEWIGRRRNCSKNFASLRKSILPANIRRGSV